MRYRKLATKVSEESKTTNDDYNNNEEGNIIIAEGEEAGKVKKKYAY